MTSSSQIMHASKTSSPITILTPKPPDLVKQSIRNSPQMMRPQSVVNGIPDTVSQSHADINMNATIATGSTKQKTVPQDGRNLRRIDKERLKRPCWTRGFLWSHRAPSRTPSATLTETAPPLVSVPTSELNSIAANVTINAHPKLFKIVTPINVDKFESLLVQHPNCPLVNSICHSLREGA